MTAAKRNRRPHERARVAAKRATAVAAVRSSGPLGLRLRAQRSVLLIVDVQQRLAPALPEAQRVIDNCTVLMSAAARLKVPIIVTEHCPERLGPALAEIRNLAAATDIVAKTHFSAADEPHLVERLAALSRPQVVIAGAETHVCVLQTALGLVERGYRSHVVADAAAARRGDSHQLALRRLALGQIPVLTTEMVLFEWLERADHPKFRELLALIR